MSEDRSRRLSQIFDPLSRFSDLSGAGQSVSTPNSPRLLPRRQREAPPPPPRPHHPREEAEAPNWQERCLELQLELHRSRHQATRVRDMLRDKTKRLTALGSQDSLTNASVYRIQPRVGFDSSEDIQEPIKNGCNRVSNSGPSAQQSETPTTAPPVLHSSPKTAYHLQSEIHFSLLRPLFSMVSGGELIRNGPFGRQVVIGS
ncbi:hypothetical protein JYU34_013743 [Plutella xylostella]|uniref:Uncharacterized protein n=1 Tax=Plutella xylostella TaxID=51655 RepID=A0ABQ7QAH7_PLUXY|nr:hypothetical protein JYU34_013743 [Plutella xylostella]